MKQINFTAETINPQTLGIHPILIESGYDFRPDQYFADAFKTLRLYERPVIVGNYTLTHSEEVLTAQQNGEQSLDVYKVDLTDMQIRLLVYLKHRNHLKNLVASFNTIKFFEDYLDKDPEGIAMAESMTGTTRQKIAVLMQTSDSTIKRIKAVGEYKYEKLGLIQEGEVSFKEVLAEIKLERMAANQERKQAELAENSQPANAQPTVEVSNGDSDDTEGEEEQAEAEGDVAVEIKPENADNAVTATPMFNFTSGSLSIGGIGDLVVNVTDDIAQVLVNGKRLDNLNYYHVTNRDSEENGRSESFVVTQSGKKPFSIQITVENFSQAA